MPFNWKEHNTEDTSNPYKIKPEENIDLTQYQIEGGGYDMNKVNKLPPLERALVRTAITNIAGTAGSRDPSRTGVKSADIPRGVSNSKSTRDDKKK